MARSTTAASSARSSRSRAKSREVAAEPVGLELIGVALCLGSVLVAAALATLAPASSGGSLRNVTGVVGRNIGEALTAAGRLCRVLGSEEDALLFEQLLEAPDDAETLEHDV